MKTTRLRSVALAALLALSSAGAGAAPRPGHEGRPRNPEAQAYYQRQVLPVLQQQRQKLEQQLSADDRAQLASCRRQLRALQEQEATLRRSFGPPNAAAQPGFWPELTDAQRDQLHQLRAQSHAVLMNVAELAQKYRDNLAQLAQELQPQREKWAADLRAMVVKNASSDPQRPAGPGGRMPGHRPQPGPADLHHAFRPVMFLLMDPAPAAAPALGGVSLYPNPVATTSQLDYELPAAGPVSVELLDKDGNKLRTLVHEAQAGQGAHTQQLNLTDLPSGTYYYKITAAGASETRRFVKE